MSSKAVTRGSIDVEPLLKATAVGFAVAFVALTSFSVGGELYQSYYQYCFVAAIVLVRCSLFIVAAHAILRGAVHKAKCLVSSGRLDILAGALIGAASALGVYNLNAVQTTLSHLPVSLVLVAFALSSVAMGAAFLREVAEQLPPDLAGLSFLSDGEISAPEADALNIAGRAKYFAEMVEKEGGRGAIVFGVDGAWGIGKSSFINLAQCAWDKNEKIIVFRFEPLKFGGEKDLVRSFVRELSGEIRSNFFAPELRPLASRYARMIKADPSVSLPGFRLSMREDGSTIDEIINDLDDVLERIGRRVIVVVDDLDRVETEMVNRVLFMVRRSMMARNIAYVLVYDAERMISSSGNESTREYFEKFVNASVSLFVDLNDLAKYLSHGWKGSLPSAHSSQSANVLGLQSILSAVAELLASDRGGSYIGLVGNLRKIKRMINAMLMMEMGRFELQQTDFDRRDLVHLLLLYLNYPGVFREIYANEGENRSGIFSARPLSGPGEVGYGNAPELKEYLGKIGPDQRYLVAELFEMSSRGLSGQRPSRQQVNSLACFNSLGRRNLSAYLGLIVRSVVPDPLQTEALYEGLLTRVRSGASISSVLDDSLLAGNADAQAKFWGSLAASTHSLDKVVLVEAIATIVEKLPTYSYGDAVGASPRSSAIYSLAIIVNSAFGEVAQASEDEASRAKQIRELIVGSGREAGLLRTLATADRGVPGLHDMLLLRLLCCADRGNQLRNIHLALLPEDLRLNVKGRRSDRVVEAVRRASQIAFQEFKTRYIDGRRNFLSASIEDISVDQATGETVVTDRSGKGFIIYQLANSLAPTGSGVGCGYFDEYGAGDGCGIAREMNAYLFEVCFAPINEENKLAFADYCLANFSRDYFNETGSVPTRQSLEQGLDVGAFRAFWNRHGPTYKAANLEAHSRRVVTANYTAWYADDLPKVWDVLDNEESSGWEGEDAPLSPHFAS